MGFGEGSAVLMILIGLCIRQVLKRKLKKLQALCTVAPLRGSEVQSLDYRNILKKV